MPAASFIDHFFLSSCFGDFGNDHDGADHGLVVLARLAQVELDGLAGLQVALVRLVTRRGHRLANGLIFLVGIGLAVWFLRQVVPADFYVTGKVEVVVLFYDASARTGRNSWSVPPSAVSR